jgi:hypothetical protein
MEIRSVPGPLLYATPEADGNQVHVWSPFVRHRQRLMEIMSVSDPLLYAIPRG